MRAAARALFPVPATASHTHSSRTCRGETAALVLDPTQLLLRQSQFRFAAKPFLNPVRLVARPRPQKRNCERRPIERQCRPPPLRGPPDAARTKDSILAC